jgi:hypothetical protein
MLSDGLQRDASFHLTVLDDDDDRSAEWTDALPPLRCESFSTALTKEDKEFGDGPDISAYFTAFLDDPIIFDQATQNDQRRSAGGSSDYDHVYALFEPLGAHYGKCIRDAGIFLREQKKLRSQRVRWIREWVARATIEEYPMVRVMRCFNKLRTRFFQSRREAFLTGTEVAHYSYRRGLGRVRTSKTVSQDWSGVFLTKYQGQVVLNLFRRAFPRHERQFVNLWAPRKVRAR